MKPKTVHLAIAALAILTACTAPGHRPGETARITVGTVERVEPVTLASNAPQGAIVGGTLGLIAGNTSSRRARNAIIGAAAGGAVAAGAQGSRAGAVYTVRPVGAGGTVRIVSDQTQIAVGDCVAIEEVRGTANIRRMPAAACVSGAQAAVRSVDAQMQAEANACLRAKDELIAATTPEAVELASRKIDILCN